MCPSPCVFSACWDQRCVGKIGALWLGSEWQASNRWRICLEGVLALSFVVPVHHTRWTWLLCACRLEDKLMVSRDIRCAVKNSCAMSKYMERAYQVHLSSLKVWQCCLVPWLTIGTCTAECHHLHRRPRFETHSNSPPLPVLSALVAVVPRRTAGVCTGCSRSKNRSGGAPPRWCES